jgi:hypothetical protein
LSLDDSRLRGLLAWANGKGNSVVAIAPEVGSLLAMSSTGDIEGLRLSSTESMPVRAGKLHGRMEGDHLHLQFESAFDPIPYKLYREFPLKEDVLKDSTAQAFSPFSVDARVDKVAGVWEAIALTDRSSESRKQVLWSAQRVGPTP